MGWRAKGVRDFKVPNHRKDYLRKPVDVAYNSNGMSDLFDSTTAATRPND
jgi:hypothetical protein